MGCITLFFLATPTPPPPPSFHQLILIEILCTLQLIVYVLPINKERGGFFFILSINFNLGHWFVFVVIHAEIEFLDINLKKDSSVLLHSIHSLFCLRNLKKNHSLLWFKKSFTKIRKRRKLESSHE